MARVAMGPSQGGTALTLLAGFCAAALLAGCSGSSSGSTTSARPTASTTPSITASPSVPASGTGACQYVTTAQASALAQSPVKPGVQRSVVSGGVTFSYCDYIFDPGNSPGVIVAVADLGSNGTSLFAQFRASKSSDPDNRAVADVGDEAFYSNGNLNVRKGNKGVILFVGRSSGYPRNAAAIPDEKSLAALVLVQL